MKKVNCAIIGCGNIAETYVKQMADYPEVELLGFADAFPERAKTFAEKYSKKAYATPQELMKDPKVEVVINLTIHHAHLEVITQCIEAGKHVHTEKPMTMSYADSKKLVELANRKGVRLSSSPTTYLGESLLEARKRVLNGELGTVRYATAEINHGRPESWHPNPKPFYEVGVLWDVALYPITFLTAIFGPIERVNGFGAILLKTRKPKEGAAFEINKPDFIGGILRFRSGVVARLSTNFYALGSKHWANVEIHGDDGSLHLGDSFSSNAPLEMAVNGKAFEKVPMPEAVFQGARFSSGVQNLCQSLLAKKPHMAQGAHACHVIEVLEALEKSTAAESSPVVIESTFDLPEISS